MPTKVTSWSKDLALPSGTVRSHTFSSTSSTTLTAGKQDRRAQNPYTKSFTELKSLMCISDSGYYRHPPQPDNSFDYAGRDFSGADNIAYGKFRGRLHYGGTSLGVSLAEWRSSSEMIYNRSLGPLNAALDRTFIDLKRDKELRKKILKRGVLARDILATWDEHGNVVGRTAKLRIDPYKRARIARLQGPTRSEQIKEVGAFVKDSAGNYLEYIFGWVPLCNDLKGAFSTLTKNSVPDNWIVSRGRTYNNYYADSSGSYDTMKVRILQELKTTYCVNVAIDNPNTWLLNRAGLLSAQTVMWDLVPWSFVVNMFVNVNAMLSSMTDTVGLTLTNQSITRTVHSYQTRHQARGKYSQPTDTGYNAVTTTVWKQTRKTRSLNVPLRPTLSVRVPELNLDLLLMASALTVQRMNRITRLFT